MSPEGRAARAVAGGVVLAERLRVARTHWSRLKGLLGTASLTSGEGLWLAPCSQVHMIGMRYALDVVFLDADRRVVCAISNLQPGKISPKVRAARSVLELPTGTVARAALVEGVRVDIDGADVPELGCDGDSAPDGRAATVNAIVCNVLLAALYCFFVAAHVGFVRRTGQWTTVAPLVLQESMLTVLFLTRRRSVATSDRPIDWAVGISGVLLPLLMRPIGTASSLAQIGETLQIVGLSVAAVAVGFLGRSVGVVPANRGIKRTGTYRVVRHPMYAAYLVSYVGYVLTYPSWRNVLLTGGTGAALYARAVAEERLLTQDPGYRDYLGATRWRFFPYVY
jgi:protein-S-isoprenylcysteine O-methyltransferase Ste14/uncharacterized membrane protein (UPF0127 family)